MKSIKFIYKLLGQKEFLRKIREEEKKRDNCISKFIIVVKCIVVFDYYNSMSIYR